MSQGLVAKIEGKPLEGGDGNGQSTGESTELATTTNAFLAFQWPPYSRRLFSQSDEEISSTVPHPFPRLPAGHFSTRRQFQHRLTEMKQADPGSSPSRRQYGRDHGGCAQSGGSYLLAPIGRARFMAGIPYDNDRFCGQRGAPRTRGRSHSSVSAGAPGRPQCYRDLRDDHHRASSGCDDMRDSAGLVRTAVRSRNGQGRQRLVWTRRNRWRHRRRHRAGRSWPDVFRGARPSSCGRWAYKSSICCRHSTSSGPRATSEGRDVSPCWPAAC